MAFFFHPKSRDDEFIHKIRFVETFLSAHSNNKLFYKVDVEVCKKPKTLSRDAPQVMLPLFRYDHFVDRFSLGIILTVCMYLTRFLLRQFDSKLVSPLLHVIES